MGDTLVNLATPGVVPHAHTAFDADLDLVDDLLHNFIKELETDGERVCVHTALPPPLCPTGDIAHSLHTLTRPTVEPPGEGSGGHGQGVAQRSCTPQPHLLR